jgi:hypothetical protein
MQTWIARRSTSSRLARAAAVAGWMGVIFAVSSIPGSRLPGGYSVQGHVGEYAVLGALLLVALVPEIPSRAAPWAALAFASLYGITDEVHQIFVPGRMPDPADWAADTVGAGLGVALALVVMRVIAERRGRE